MESRNFDLSEYSQYEYYKFDSVESFMDGPTRHGISEIAIGDRPLHLLFEDRGAATTLVHFTAALPSTGWDTYPVFAGIKTARGRSVNHLSISDPNFSFDGRPSTGWFAGSENQDLQNILASIIRHCTKAGNEGQAILFGSSAGGFAAVYYGSLIPESLTICVNPRIDLRNRPTQFYRLRPLSFPETEEADLDRRIDVSASEFFAKNKGNTLAYIQNVQDRPYFEENMIPFIRQNHEDERIWLHLVDSGPQHRLPLGTDISDLLDEMITCAPNWKSGLQRLGYVNAPSQGYALQTREFLVSENQVQ